MKTKDTRMKSLDVLRGCCMLAILFFHTQIYYLGTDVVPYTLYVPNALALFYFISGFFAGRRLAPMQPSLMRIVTHLLIPYIIFTIILGLVKQLFVMPHFDFRVMVSNIVSGRASWFIAALIIIEVLMLFARRLCKDNSLCILLFGIAGATTAYFIQRQPDAISNFEGGIPFAVAPAMLGLFYYCLGLLFYRYVLPHIPMRTPLGLSMRDGDTNGKRTRMAMRVTWCCLTVVTLAFLLIKVWEYQANYRFLFASLWADPYPLFVIDMLLGCLSLTTLSLLIWPDAKKEKIDTSLKLEHTRMYHFMSPAWIGMNCLVFYFFAGAVPLVVTLVLQKLLFTTTSSVWYTDLGFWFSLLIVIAVASAIAACIYTYLPFLVGHRKNDK